MSISEQIINGTYKNENSISDKIINGTYNEKQKNRNVGNITDNILKSAKTLLPTYSNMNENKNYSKMPIKNYSTLDEKNNNVLPSLASSRGKNFLMNNINQNIDFDSPINPNNSNQFHIDNVYTPNSNASLLDLATGLGKTVINTVVQAGKGISDFAENVVDAAYQFGSSKYNPFMKLAFGDDIESGQNIAKELIQENQSEQLLNNLGYNNVLSNGKTVQETLDDGSLIRSDNMAGKIIQSVGQQLPSMFIGSKVPGPIGEVLSLGSTGISTFGSAVDEAYNNGATREEATTYGLMSSAIETATEKMFAGIGGLFGKGALDDAIKNKITNKISNTLLKNASSFGLDMVGEGTEEVVSDLLQPLAQKLTYASEEDLKKLYSDQNYLEDFISGALSSAVMQGISLPTNQSKYSNDKKTIENQTLPKSNINNVTSNNQQTALPTANINSKYNNTENVLNNQNNILNDNNLKIANNTNVFSQQIDAVMNGTYPKTDMLVVSQNTPKILQEIGLNNLPITLTQRHLKTIMNSNGEYTGANYHDLGVDLVKQLPQAISNPLNIIKSNTDANSIVVITELADKQDRPIIASIKIDGKGVINNIEIDSNVMTSAYGKDNYDSFMKKNIANGNMLYDIDDGIIKRSGGKLQLRPTTSIEAPTSKSQEVLLSKSNIPQFNNNVKSNTLPKYSMQENINNTQELNDSSFNLQNSEGKKIDISNLKETNYMKQFTFNRKYNKDSITTYRGVGENGGTGVAMYGLGLYTTLDKNYAKQYGNVITVDNSLLPNNPLHFKTQNDFKIWEQELARQLNIKRSELYGEDYGVEQYLNKLGYDGLMIGTGKDTDLISFTKTATKYSQNNSTWQEHLEKNYKTTGTRTNMRKLKEGILPTYKQVKELNKVAPIIKEQIPIKELNAKKYENNKNAIGRLEQEKYKTIKNIDDKIKSKTEEYNSKSNKDTIVANKLNQQISALNNQKQNIEAEYNKRINTLRTRNEKMTTKEFKTNEQKMTKKQEYDQLALELIENMKNWKDKNKGLKYKINTMERNLYDIIPDKIEAKRIIDTYIKPITENNALSEKFINQYNEKIQSLNLNNKESVAVQMLGESKYIETLNDKTISASEIVKTAEEYIRENNLDRNKIQNAVGEFRKVYDELIYKINFTLKQQGFKEIEYRKDYFPHFDEPIPNSKIGKLAEKLGWKFIDNEIPTSIAGITDTFKPSKIWTSFTQRRYGNSTSYNALKGFDNYIRGAANLIYHTEDIQKLRSLENMIRYQYSEKSIQDEYNKITNMDLNDDAKARLIEDLFDKVDNPLGNLVTELRSYTDNLANKKSELDRRIEHNVGRKFYNTATNIQNRLSANMVGLNISSALTNFIPITQAWSQVSTKNLLRGIKQSISNNFREDGLVDNSVFLTNRTKQADRLYKTNLEKVSDKFNVVFDAVDSFTSNTVVRAKYLDNLEKGMSSKQAIEDADQFAKNLIAGRDKGSMPTIFNSKNPIVKLFTSFQLEVANQYNYMFKDMPRNLKNQGILKLTSAFLKMFLGAWLWNKFSDSLTGRKSAFSPIDIISETVDEFKKDKSIYNKLSSTTKSVASELPFIGGLLGGGRLPISSALPDLGTTVESITNLGNDDKRQTAIKNLEKELSKPLFYVAMPFGGGQLKKTIEGASMYSNKLPTAGSYTNSGNLRFTVDKSPIGVTKALIFGQYSSKEAKDYINSDYKAINSNKIQEMKDIDMTSSEYREYTEGLKNAGNKNEDKINYINNLDISISKKNIMANNVLDSKYKIDMKDYNSKDGYKVLVDEQKLKKENPNKYNLIKNAKIDYSNYSNYSKKVSEIKKQYSNSNIRRQKVFEYINSLNYSKGQKIILYKMIGGYSITDYKNEMYEYIENLKISKTEKESIWKQLYGGD